MAVYKTVSTGASSTQRVLVSIDGQYGWDKTDSGGVVIRVNGTNRCSSRGDYWTSFSASFELAVGTSTVTVEYFHGRVNYCNVNIQLIETTFSISTSAGTGGRLSANYSSAASGTVVTLTPVANTGYQFSSYTKSPSSLSISGNKFTMPSQAVSITANFSKINYSISKAVSPSGGGSVTVASTAQMGDSVSVSQTPATGYRFSSWSTSPSLSISNNKFTMPASNVSITANYAKISYSITKAVNPSGAGTVTAPSSATYGDTVTLSQTPSTGYRFTGWTTSPTLTISNNKFTMPAGNVTITANYEKVSYEITKSVNPAGSGTVTVPSIATYGDTVTLSQTPAAGYLFTSWSSSDVTISDNKFTMPAKAVSIVANYKLGRSTAALDKASYEVGETAALTITPQDNSFTHRYKLSFGSGMETDWISLAANVKTASIYLPIAWSLRMDGTSVTGGTLTLETYSGTTLFGTYTITGLTLSAKDGVVPSFTVWRVDEAGNAKQDGEYARYAYTLPSGMTDIQITCGGVFASEPPTSGDVLPGNRLELNPGGVAAVALQFIYGSETVRISRDAPGIRKVFKIIHIL